MFDKKKISGEGGTLGSCSKKKLFSLKKFTKKENKSRKYPINAQKFTFLNRMKTISPEWIKTNKQPKPRGRSFFHDLRLYIKPIVKNTLKVKDGGKCVHSPIL